MIYGESAIWSISGFGMSFERARLEASALNVSNANAAINQSDANGFRPVSVVATGGATQFQSMLMGEMPQVQTVMNAEAVSFRQQPEHPLANAQGMVMYPKVDTVSEMIQVMSATRAYEANVKVLNAAMDMGSAAREIGKL